MVRTAASVPRWGRGRGAQPEPGALGLTRAALAHPRQARPGGALGLSRGAGPGRGCGGGRGRGRGAQRRARRPRPRARRPRATFARANPPPLPAPPAPSSSTGKKGGECGPPRERKGEAEGAGLSLSPAPSASRAQPSHILGRPGPGGALGLPRGAGPRRGCARPAYFLTLSPLFHPPPLSRLQPPQRTWRGMGLTTARTQRRSCATRPTTAPPTAPRYAKATGGRTRSSSAPIATRAATTSAAARTEHDLRRVAKKSSRTPPGARAS